MPVPPRPAQGRPRRRRADRWRPTTGRRWWPRRSRWHRATAGRDAPPRVRRSAARCRRRPQAPRRRAARARPEARWRGARGLPGPRHKRREASREADRGASSRSAPTIRASLRALAMTVLGPLSAAGCWSASGRAPRLRQTSAEVANSSLMSGTSRPAKGRATASAMSGVRVSRPYRPARRDSRSRSVAPAHGPGSR